jgi:preprotein translocase subunit SecE
MFSGLKQRIENSPLSPSRLLGREAPPAKVGKAGKGGKPAKAAPTESRFRRFVRETRSELKKVTWPTREQTIRLTGIVIAFSAVVGLLMGGVDFIFSSLIQWMIGVR